MHLTLITKSPRRPAGQPFDLAAEITAQDIAVGGTGRRNEWTQDELDAAVDNLLARIEPQHREEALRQALRSSIPTALAYLTD